MKPSLSKIKLFLLILTVLASIKMLLQNFSLDEEYQIMMSYRNIMGDTMVDTMWEPHQTSSFLCTVFMWPYFKLTGTFTGVVIYLRFMGTLVHLGITCYLYRVFSHFLKKDYAFYLALFFFNTIPKLIMLPEFGGMQVWFGLLCFLMIIDSAEDISLQKCGTRPVRAYTKLIFAGLFLCLEVLSYPSCVFLLIPFLFMIWYFHNEKRIAKCLIFTATCGVIGFGYAAYFWIKLGTEVFWRNISAILNSDLTHTFDTGLKLRTILGDLGHYLIFFLILTAAAFLFCMLPPLKKHLPKKKEIAVTGILLLLSVLYQLFSWIFLNTGYEYLQLYLAVTLCLGLWFFAFRLHDSDTFSRYMLFGASIGLISLACVMMLTDLNLLSSIPHGMLGSICMLAFFVHITHSYERFLYTILLAFCYAACIGKGYTLRGGMDYNNVLQSENICKHGPAIGTISNYMGAYIYNNEYKLWQDTIPEGSKVLIATDNVHSTNTIQYTFKNAEVCHYSIVDPTAYDERLLTYWSYYPEKKPDIIVIDCWFGNMLFAEDSWIVQYIEHDFGYTEVIDGDYVRIYKK